LGKVDVMKTKKEVTKEEYKALIDEILLCRESLKNGLDKFEVNAIDRLIIARINLENSTIKGER
jgi:hypothetical protein